MKRTLIRLVSLILLVCIIIGAMTSCAKNNLPGVNSPGSTAPADSVTSETGTVLGHFTDREILEKTDALAAIQEVATITGITDVSATLGDVKEYTSLESKFYRFDQVYEGIPVYGRSVTVGASTEGESQGLSHNYMQIQNLDTVPSITEDQAKEVATASYSSEAVATSVHLTVYTLFGYPPTLAWQVEVMGPATLETCFVDAHTGEIISSFSGIFTETETGTYTDANGTIEFSTQKENDGTYTLFDATRNLEVYDANYHTATLAVVDDAGNVYHWDSTLKAWVDSQGRKVEVPAPDIEFGTWNVFDMSGNIVGRNADYLPCTGTPLLKW